MTISIEDRDHQLVIKLIDDLVKFYNSAGIMDREEKINHILCSITSTLSDGILGFLICLVGSIQKQGCLVDARREHIVIEMILHINGTLTSNIAQLLAKPEISAPDASIDETPRH